MSNHDDHKQLGVTEDLEKAIVSSRRALAFSRQANSHSHATSLNNLANCLFARYIHLGVLGDLHEVVTLDREALDLRPLGRPDRSSSLNNLAVDLSARYKQLGALQDLREAISLAREALHLRPKGHHDRSSALNNLAVHLLQLGTSQDIDEAIIFGREAFGLRTIGTFHRFSPANNLAVYLFTRYQELETLHDLDEAIIFGREALDLCLKEHRDRSSSLNHLTLYLLTRHQCLGTLQDIDEAIVLGRDSLELCPKGHPNRSSSLDNLALYLSTRHKQLGTLQDLDEVIVLGREVLNLRPEGHPMHGCSLDNLARNLTTRYNQLRALQDIQGAIALEREALNLRPKGHLDHPLSLNIIASCLSARFKHLGASQDLEEAIMLGREALDLSPNGHPHRLCSLDCLTRNLSTRYKKLGDIQDLEDVLVLVREALDLRPISHPNRLCSLHVLARHLSARCKKSGTFQDLKEAIVLEREALDLRLKVHPSLDLVHQSGRYDFFGAMRDCDETIVLAREASDLPSLRDVLLERNKVFLASESWRDALDDANQVITLDPSLPWGYEVKRAALRKQGKYALAISTFKTMLSKIDNSPDPKIRNCRNDYVRPWETIMAVRLAVQHAARGLPSVLIHTKSGRLCARSDQTKSFEESKPIFEELISSITTSIDLNRIEEEVKQYYRYATFSHKWEEHEPLFEKVVQIVVYDLEKSPAHHKLQMFCQIVRDAGLHWAWSDTCCINKGDHTVIQEALVSMFKWYEGSTVTIVHLCDVHSTGRRGDLVNSVWNSRSWTFQEYHASQVVRFYTNDWKPYLNLDVPNHKLAPEIISEMEEVTRVPAQTLVCLQPGPEDIRDKLRLASGRKTTYIEDSAYSLLGIFNVSLPVTYGDRDKALGKLLARLLTTSGDTSILAWSGASGSYNSCLPESITVFDQPPTTHIPQAINHTEMDEEILSLRSSPFEHAERLYKKLRDLPTPGFADRRMRLPCIKFQLGPLVPSRNTSQHGYRARASELGVVEIHTKEDLSRCGPLYVVHPWIDHLLNHHPHMSAVETTTPEGSIDGYSDILASPPGPSRARTTQSRRQHLVQRLTIPLRGRTTTGVSLLLPDTASVLPPTLPSAEEHRAQVLQCMVRLKAPFGALLLAPKRAGNTRDFKRVAVDCHLTVRVLEGVQLKALVECVDVVEVL